MSDGTVLREGRVLDAIFASEELFVAVFDGRLRALRVSNLVALMFKCAPADLVGKTLQELLGGFPHITAAAEAVLLDGQRRSDLLLRGERVTTRGEMIPVFLGDERGVLGMFRPTESVERLASRVRFEELLGSLATRLFGARGDSAAGEFAAGLAEFAEAELFDYAAVELRGAGTITGAAWDRGAATATTDTLSRLTACNWVASTHEAGASVFVEDSASLPEAAADVRAIAEEHGWLSLAVLPLRVAATFTGAFAVGAKVEHKTWTHGFRTRLQLFGQVMGNALARSLVEARDAEEWRFEQMLAALSERLLEATSGRMDEVVAQAIADLPKHLPIVRAHVARVDLARKLFVVTQLSSPHPAMRKGSEVPFDAFTGRSAVADALEGRVRFFRAEEHLPPFRAYLESTGALGMAIVPVRVAGKLLGAMALYVKVPWDEEIERRALWFARILAQAVMRSRAEEERHAVVQELARLKARAESERDYLRKEIDEVVAPGRMIAESPTMLAVLDSARRVAPKPTNVFLRGEPGVGKELVARNIHTGSARSAGPFVKVACSAIPRELFEVEMFGRGADRPGRLELADGGTLFLDAVGDLPLEVQPRLLRVLEEGQNVRPGDDVPRRVDVRVVSSTDRDLEGEVRLGRFRSDLYFRLCAFPIVVPPLRDRSVDVVPIARHLLSLQAQRRGIATPVLLPDDEQLLLAYDWPGNVRELVHVVERAVVLSGDGQLRIGLAMPGATPSPPAPPVSTRAGRADRADREILLRALEGAAWRIAGSGGAAERLGLSPSTLRDRMRILGIEAPPGSIPRGRRR